MTHDTQRRHLFFICVTNYSEINAKVYLIIYNVNAVPSFPFVCTDHMFRGSGIWCPGLSTYSGVISGGHRLIINTDKHACTHTHTHTHCLCAAVEAGGVTIATAVCHWRSQPTAALGRNCIDWVCSTSTTKCCQLLHTTPYPNLWVSNVFCAIIVRPWSVYIIVLWVFM